MEKEWNSQIEEWNKNLFYETGKNKNKIITWFLKYVKRKDKILDQGCGIGQYALTIYKLGFKNITGIDFSKKLIEEARKNNKKLKYKCKFVVGDIRNMQFKSNSFDIVISAGIVEHVPETKKAILELSRVIKKSGILIIHVPHKISIFTLLKNLQQFFGIWKLGYEKSFTKNEFSKLLESNEFEILDYHLSPFKHGNHRVIGGIIELFDKPMYILGLGGHHLCFLCKKNKLL